MLELNKSNFEKEISEGYTVVDFWATWCGPCIKMKPVFEEAAAEYTKAKFAKIQVDKSPEEQELASGNEVRGIPCIIIFKDGKEVERLVGYREKEQLISELDGIIG